MIPSATYRLQFRNGVTFDTAIDLIPHLQNLGISHLYASPIFAAVEGSTHGYDVVDPNVIDPAIGGREGFERMSSRLKEAGLGFDPWTLCPITWRHRLRTHGGAMYFVMESTACTHDISTSIGRIS